MSNQTIVITGASRGLGAAAARIAAESGANVVVNARSADKLSELVQQISQGGGQALAVAGDVSQLDVCQRIVEKTMKRFGRIDALVNNAGIIEPITPLAESDPAAWQHNLLVNVLAPLMLTQAALPHLRASKGRVINVSSGAAVSAIAGWSAYCASKGALNQFNRSLALEEPDITAISLRPGIIDTEMQAQIRRQGTTGMPTQVHQRFVGFHQAGQLQPPEVPGRALVALALHAPHQWSGEFVSWDEERVQSLTQNHN